MTALSTPVTVKAHRTFSVEASNMVAVVASRTWNGDLVLQQGDRKITLSLASIGLFKKAVADMQEIV